MVRSILPNALISVFLKNMFEYPGIRAIWDLGQRIPTSEAKHSTILYFHSKGMSKIDEGVRIDREQHLFNTVIRPWREIIPKFEEDPSINKICFQTASCGFCWYNFWWVRASYIENLVCPIIIGAENTDRFYYEKWLGYKNENNVTWPKIHNLNIFDMKSHGLCSGAHDCVALLAPHDQCFDSDRRRNEGCTFCEGYPSSETGGNCVIE